jgi:hypothetical protein
VIGRLSAAALAKAKMTGLVAISMTAGSVGGAVALSHAAPVSHIVQNAASASPSPDDEVTATPEATEPTTDPETVDGTDGEADDSEADDTAVEGDGAESYVLPECPGDVRNHGEYTSFVARSAATAQVGGHGDWTRQAAQSDCGKPDGAGGKATGEDGDDTEDADAKSAHADAVHGNGHHVKADGTEDADETDDGTDDTSTELAPATHGHGDKDKAAHDQHAGHGNGGH